MSIPASREQRKPIVYTEAMDAAIERMVLEGAETWVEIGRAIGVPVTGGSVSQHVRNTMHRLDLIAIMVARSYRPKPPEPTPEEPRRTDFTPLPPGHPFTWSPLVAGTAIEGASYA